jgi:hypothetical protein
VAELGLRVSQADVARDLVPLEASRCPEVWIYFGDEAGIHFGHHSGTTGAAKGQIPVVRATGSRFGMNLISAVSANGQLRFMATPDRTTAPVFVAFRRRLIHQQERPVFLIVDNHSKPSGPHRQGLRGEQLRAAGPLLPAVLLPGAEPRRVGVVSCKEPSGGASGCPDPREVSQCQ